MDEPGERTQADGMGPVPSGPSFLPWYPAAGPGPRSAVPGPPLGPSPGGRSRPPGGPPPGRLGAVLTVVAVGVVALVVAVASLVARYADTHIAAPAVTSPPSASAAASEDRIQFTTTKGTGELIMLTREWISDGAGPPASGSYLRIEVELVCSSGRVDYDPYNFQVFDRSGDLFELAVDGAGSALLDVGTLRSGERVRGTVAFDLPRGEATLLMSDDSDQTVTALRVPD